MAEQWFCKLAGVVTGPLKASELRALAQAGKLSPEDLVRQGEDGPWIAARNVRGLFGSAAQRPAEPSTPEKSSGSQTVQVSGSKERRSTASKQPKIASATWEEKPKATGLPTPPRTQVPPLPGNWPSSALASQTAQSSSADVELGLPMDSVSSSSVDIGGSKGATPAAQPVPLPELHKTRQLQNNLWMIAVLAGTAVLLLVVVVLLVSGVISVGDRPQVGRKKASEPPKSAGIPQAAESSETSEISWVDASRKAIRRAGTSVRVASVRVAEPPAAWNLTPGEYLLVEIQIKNQAEEKLLTFRGWQRGGPNGTLLKLTDNKGNTYSQIPPASPMNQEQAESVERLPPGHSHSETLVFSSPAKIEEIEYLRLELPGWAFPKEKFDPFRFQIPAKMIRIGEQSAGPLSKAEDLFGPSLPSPSMPKEQPPEGKQEPPPIPQPKKDPGQEEFEQLLKQLEKEEKASPSPEKEKAPPNSSASQEQMPESTEKAPSDSKPSKSSGSRLPGQDIMDQLDTPVPPKRSSQEKD
ncbi:MAG: DUF4339 domain-containing protein [Thermoguttaceae bacterium]|nr:DUF4339 domain-containing protein [Thermoguttaceae bacterium]MDW8037317.1 DUF4339 domain-containing protein [Thermoguttaceae bacterium]